MRLENIQFNRKNVHNPHQFSSLFISVQDKERLGEPFLHFHNSYSVAVLRAKERREGGAPARAGLF